MTESVGLTRLAARGAQLLVARNVAARGIGLVGTIALVALIGPALLGIFAVGLSLLRLLQVFGAFGLAPSVVRRTEPPTSGEQRALLSVQLGLGLSVVSIALVATFVLLPALDVPSGDARAMAVLLVVLPLTAWRVVPACLLERDMRFGALSVIELAEQLLFYCVALPTAALGLGIWSLTAGALAGAAGAGAIALAFVPRLLVPTVRLSPLRPLWRFAATYQLSHLLHVVRDFGLNALLLATAGATTAGIWALVQRLLLAPSCVLQALWRVGFVAYSQISDRREVERQAQKVLALAALALGALLATTTGALPALVEVVLGDEWDGVVLPFTLAALGIAVSGPLSGAILGLLQARGDLRAPLTGLTAQIVLLWSVAIVAAPALGADAIGAAWLAAALVDFGILLALSRPYAVLNLRPVAIGVGIAAAGGAIGQVVGSSIPNAAGLVLAAAAALATWSVLALVCMPSDFRRLAGLTGIPQFAGLLARRHPSQGAARA